MPNGQRKFPDGTIVDGSNDGVGYIGLHDDIFSPSMSEIDHKEDEMKLVRAQVAVTNYERAQEQAKEAKQQ